MKKHPRSLLKLLLLLFITSVQAFAATPLIIGLIAYIPQMIQIAKQTLLSIAFVAGYYVNVKPEFPSRAEQDFIQLQQLVKPNQEILNEVSTKTGIIINPDFVNQLNAAGMHHDFQKIAQLLNSAKHTQDLPDSNNIKQLCQSAQKELNHYKLVPGIRSFAEQHNLKNAHIE